MDFIEGIERYRLSLLSGCDLGSNDIFYFYISGVGDIKGAVDFCYRFGINIEFSPSMFNVNNAEELMGLRLLPEYSICLDCFKEIAVEDILERINCNGFGVGDVIFVNYDIDLCCIYDFRIKSISSIERFIEKLAELNKQFLC